MYSGTYQQQVLREVQEMQELKIMCAKGNQFVYFGEVYQYISDGQ